MFKISISYGADGVNTRHITAAFTTSFTYKFILKMCLKSLFQMVLMASTLDTLLQLSRQVLNLCENVFKISISDGADGVDTLLQLSRQILNHYENVFKISIPDGVDGVVGICFPPPESTRGHRQCLPCMYHHGIGVGWGGGVGHVCITTG